MIDAMHQDVDALGIERPDHEPRATDYVPQMLSMIGALEHKGLAYRAGSGDVNFAVRKFPGYGKLSGKSLDELHAGERVAVLDGKDDPLDFVLWKAAKPDRARRCEVGQRLRQGPPGLAHRVLGHELRDCWARPSTSMAAAPTCSFRTTRTRSPRAKAPPASRLRQTLDAQRLRQRRQREDVQVAGQLLHHPRGAARFRRRDRALLHACARHYRSPLNYSDVHLDDARSALKRLYTALELVTPAEVTTIDWANPYAARFKAAMDEDFGTPEAVAVLFDLAGEVNRTRSAESAGLLKALGGCSGPAAGRARSVSCRPAPGCDEAAIQTQIEARAAAKKARNFAEADRIRERAAGAGHRAEGLGHRHHLGSGPVSILLEIFGISQRRTVNVCYKN